VAAFVGSELRLQGQSHRQGARAKRRVSLIISMWEGGLTRGENGHSNRKVLYLNRLECHRAAKGRTGPSFVSSRFAPGRHARASTLPVEMRTTAEAAAPPADRVRKPRSFRRPLALWFTALLFFIAFLGLRDLRRLRHLATVLWFAAAWHHRPGRHGRLQPPTRGLASLLARSLTCHLCHGPILR